MHRFRLVLLLVLTAYLPSLPAQRLTGAKDLHLPDTGMLTAGALDDAGNLYLASTLNLKTLPGQNGMAGLFPAGDPVISKLGADGALLWRREFPGNFVRICDMAITPDQALVITGGYVDSLRLAPGWVLPGTNDDNASFFVARLDPDGNFTWIDTKRSTLPEDCIGWTLAVSQDAIYVAGIHDAIEASLRRYDFDGQLQREKIIDIRSISDLAIDAEGRLYAAGTASPGALFANLEVPTPPSSTGYANYLARFDSSFTAQWLRATNYVTFDWHPKVAVFNDRPLLLSDDFDQGQNQFGAFRLKAYSPEGDPIWSDTVLDGFFPTDYQHFALQACCDRLLLEFPAAGAMAFRSYAADFTDSLLVQSSPASFEASFPFICTNADRTVFGSNFRSAELSLSADFVLQNAKAPVPQQFILEFDCGESSGTAAPLPDAPAWRLSPNPAGASVYLDQLGNKPPPMVDVELLDTFGRSCWQYRGVSGRIAIPVLELPVGAYFVRVTNAGKTVTLQGIRN